MTETKTIVTPDFITSMPFFKQMISEISNNSKNITDEKIDEIIKNRKPITTGLPEMYKLVVMDKDAEYTYKREIKTYKTLAAAKTALKTKKVDLTENEILKIGIFKYTEFGEFSRSYYQT